MVQMRRAIVAVIMVVAYGLAAVPRTATAESSKSEPPREGAANGPRSADEARQGAVSVRRSFGLRADEAYVADVQRRADAGEPGLKKIMGVSFTEPEAAELTERDRMGQMVPTIQSYGAAHSDSYAGVYDDFANGRLLVFFTRDVDAHVAALREQVDMPSRVEGQKANWTLAQLERVDNAVYAEAPKLLDSGAVLIQSAIMTTSNTVKAAVTSLSDRLRNYFADDIAAGRLVLEVGGPMVRSAVVTGGDRIQYVPSPTRQCSAGFSYRAGLSYGFFTAGHCGAAGNVWRHVASGQVYTAYGSSWGTGTATDSMTFPAPLSQTTNNAGWTTITGTIGIYSDTPGKPVCYYGYAAGTQECGTINSIPQSTYACDINGQNCGTLAWPRLVYMDQGCWHGATQGDSGGPVYHNNTAYGLVHGGNSPTPQTPWSCEDFTIYSAIGYAMSYWGVTIPR